MRRRQLIVCCDGTNNNLTGGHNDTNVTKLCELLEPESQDQIVYYDPGVGNPGQLPGATLSDRFSRGYQRLYGLAFGKGVYENIAEAYLFLMRHYRDGDQIFLYGFSRGAFTARSIGGLVTQFGLLRPEMEGLVSTLLHVYFSDRAQAGGDYERVRDQITALFGAGQARTAPVWFVGVWDTVASVGAPFLSREITASPTIVGKRFQHVRQALALDEYRRAFRPRPYYIDPAHDYAAGGQSIRQLWFSGAHCDIGGGYATDQARLSNEALLWLLQESVTCALRLPQSLLDADGQVNAGAVLQAQRSATPPSTPAAARVHSETYGTAWWALTGLEARNLHQVAQAAAKPLPALPLEHPSVERLGLKFPADSVWQRRRPTASLLLAAALVLLFAATAGGFLRGAVDLQSMSLWQCLLALADDPTRSQDANNQLAWWQLAWFVHAESPTRAMPAFRHVPAAILTDFALIGAYGYLLARGLTWGFAQVAQLRRASERSSAWLNRLGMSAFLAVAADVTENLLTLWLVLGYPSTLLPWSEYVVGALMSAASLAKWIGLAGCAALALWGAIRKLQRVQLQGGPR